MKKKPAVRKRTVRARSKSDSLLSLIAEVRHLIQSARRGVATVVDTFQVMTNFEIGRRIVEHEQKGEKRAAYGAELLKALSSRLTEEFGKGFSVSSLQLMRKFFLENQFRIQQQPTVKLVASEIGQQATDQLALTEKCQQASGKLDSFQILQQPTEKLKDGGIQQQPAAKSQNPFTLSWTHYVLLLTIKDPGERSFYEIEATSGGLVRA
jgi:hypothetical protein